MISISTYFSFFLVIRFQLFYKNLLVPLWKQRGDFFASRIWSHLKYWSHFDFGFAVFWRDDPRIVFHPNHWCWQDSNSKHCRWWCCFRNSCWFFLPHDNTIREADRRKLLQGSFAQRSFLARLESGRLGCATASKENIVVAITIKKGAKLFILI